MSNGRLNADNITKHSKSDFPSPSPLLSLPSELRDEIYTHAASLNPLTSRLTFTANSKTHDHHHHSLLSVNKQIRREYTRILSLSHGITATISNFDFQPLASYLASLPATYLASLPKQTLPIDYMTVREACASPGARVEVWVDATAAGSIPSATGCFRAIEGLQHWQARQSRLEARGLRLRVSYRFRGPAESQLKLGRQIITSLLRECVEPQDDITSAELMGITRGLLWQVAVDCFEGRYRDESSVVDEHEFLLASMMIESSGG